MKSFVKYITAFLLSFLIFYGGAGVNMMSYCCGDCRSAGVAVVLTDKCCEIHHHDHTAKEDHHHHDGCNHHNHQHSPATAGDDCSEHSCETDCCDMERVEFEWSNDYSPVQQPAPVELDMSLFGLPSLTLLTLLDKDKAIEAEMYIPPLIETPRVYLSKLTTLLI